MTIEIKIQNDERTIYDTVMLTEQMMMELIDNNPSRLKQIITQMCRNIPTRTTGGKNNHTSPESKKGMSYLMAAAVKFTTAE